MPDASVTIGPLTLRTFTLFLGLALAGSVALVGYQLSQRASLGAVFDAFLGALIGAAVGGRLAHVALNWTYFSRHTDEIIRLSSGGMSWHGALAGGLVGLALVARWRRLPWRPLLGALAPVLPLVALGVWYGCWAASCGYGAEVDTLARHPSWAVREAPDVYGIIAPRYDTQRFGMALSLACLLLAAAPVATKALAGARFWIVLLLFSTGMFAIGFFRGDAAPVIAGLRADQWLDLAVIALCLPALVVWWARRRLLRAKAPS